jgi:Tfp pilus assembly PilM family ATPase
VTARYLQLAHPHATGVALSDSTLRFVKFAQEGEMSVPQHAGTINVPAGLIENGRVVNKGKFISFLKTARKIHRFDTINLVLISPLVQTFSISVKGAAPLYIKEAVEKMFGLPAKDIIYEYHAIGGTEALTTFQVTTILKVVSQEFLSCFKQADITVLTLDSIGHALTRAILPIGDNSPTMVVNIDRDITTVVIGVNGKVSQTTMFAFGDDSFTDAIIEKLSVSEEKVAALKMDQGLIGDDSKKIFDALADDCAALVHHINEEYVAWHHSHKALPPVERIYLTGAGSMLKGLDEYISLGLRLPVEVANVWANCLSFDEYVPNLPQSEAVNYPVAIGAALVSNDGANMLPGDHKQAMQRKHIMGVTAKIILSFILGVAVGFAVARIIAIPTVHIQIMDVLHKIQARW